MKTKIKPYHDEAADFHNWEMPKVGSDYVCLAVILYDFVLKNNEIYYLQVFLKQFKYTEKEKKWLGIVIMA